MEAKVAEERLPKKTAYLVSFSSQSKIQRTQHVCCRQSFLFSTSWERNNSTHPVASILCCNNQVINIYCLPVKTLGNSYGTTKKRQIRSKKW